MILTVPEPKPLPIIPDEIISSMLFYVNSLPINKETRRIMNSTTDIDSNKFLSLREKLGKTTLDNLFSTGEYIVTKNQLNNKEIYLLAELFVSNINNINITDIYFDISKNMLFTLDTLKEALLNPTKELILSYTINLKKPNNEQIVLIFNKISEKKVIPDDNYLDVQLKFIFNCIFINKKKIHIILNLPLSKLETLKNSFNTIIFALKENITLTTLLLHTNNLRNERTIKIAEVLKTNTTLLILDLEDNKISYDGVTALATALQINKTLTTLNLKDNFIYSDGAKEIANALKINRTLLDLNLANSYLNKEGVVKIVNALKINNILKTLNLFGNNIGNDGVKPISEALKKNTTLIDINLINEFDDAHQVQLIESLKENTNLNLQLHWGDYIMI